MRGGFESVVVATASVCAGVFVNTVPSTIVAVLRSNIARDNYIEKKKIAIDIYY